MSKSLNLLSLSAIVMSAAVLAMPLMSTSASADASSSLNNCKYNSRARTLDCCNTIIRQYRKPMWMRTADKGCNDVVQCSGKNGYRNYRCYVRQYWDNGDGNYGGQQDRGYKDRGYKD